MFLALRIRGENAHLLSYYFGKRPDAVFERDIKHGIVRAFYGKYTQNELEFFVLHQPDTISLFKDTPFNDITNYINHRGVTANSIFASALETACRNMFQGKCVEYPDLVDRTWDIECEVGPVATRMSIDRIKELFEPLGLACDIEDGTSSPLAEIPPHPVFMLKLRGHTSVTRLIRQIFVLIPVLDNYRHHWVDKSHAEKLERLGAGWLEEHPKRNMIAYRFLQHRPLADATINAWQQEQDKDDSAEEDEAQDAIELAIEAEKKVRIHDVRHQEIIRRLDGVRRVADLGCSGGLLARKLAEVPHIEKVYAVDLDLAVLERFQRYIDDKIKKNPELAKIEIMQSSLLYYDSRIQADCLVLCEVIEHIEPLGLDMFAANVFGNFASQKVIVTTPNREYNVLFPDMKTKFRHKDHRFEWTRAEFQSWCNDVADRYQYHVSFFPIGEEHPEYGPISQMAVFTKGAA